MIFSRILFVLQAGHPVDPRVLMQAQAQAMMAGGPPALAAAGGLAGLATSGHRPLPPQLPVTTSVPRFMSPEQFQQPQPILSPNHQPNSIGLSRFFSPEVLAQAQAGNAPPLPPLPTQKAMTLEEIERQAAAVRM